MDFQAPDPGPGGKRSRLEGGAITEEAIASSAGVLHAGGYNSQLKGLQQFFTPPEPGRLARGVFTSYGDPPAVLDPTAGNGALLRAFPDRYGIEIDRDHVAAGGYTAIHGDVQRIYPMLRLAGVQFPAVVLNPPFGLDWRDGEGRSVNSTLQAFRYALGLMTPAGQGMLIAGRDRLWRDVWPEARGVFCVIDCPDLFDEVELATAIAFFCQPDKRREGDPVRLTASRSELPDLAGRVRDARTQLCPEVNSWGGTRSEQLTSTFRAVQIEHERRRQDQTKMARRYDLGLQGDTIACHPSAFAKVALAKRGLLREAERINGKSVHYFALNLREWRQLEAACADGVMTLDPAMPERVERVVRDSVRDATPIYPVKPQMRLGYVEDLDSVRCVRSDPDKGYVAGERYPLATKSKIASETGEKVVQRRDGELEARAVLKERKLLEVTVGHHAFDEGKASIEYLLDHFEIPDPGDIGSRFPAELERARGVLRDIEAEFLAPRGIRFKPFQVEDLARLLVKGKGGLGWDTGLGKTLGQMTWAEACRRYWRCQPAALFVMPQDLLPQFGREARKFFGRDVRVVRNPADAKACDRHVRAGGEGWYATYYEALSIVGRKNVAMPVRRLVLPGETRYSTRRRAADGEAAPAADSSEFCPHCLASTNDGYSARVCRRCGNVDKQLKVRTAGSLLATTFRRGVICVDEVTEMQGDDSLRGKAVRGMRCRHPLGGSGTPISNYVNSIFYGLWWFSGNANSRFPYDIDGKPQFEADFCVIEYTLAKSDDKRRRGAKERRKVLPEVTNLSMFWRLTSSNICRRRKEDTGEPIVARAIKPVPVPFGEQQQLAQKAVMADFVRWFEATHPASPLVEAGVVEQFAAGCGMLPKLDYVATLPEADPDHAWWGVASTNWTPATLKVLELALHHARAGDKVLVGSNLVETGRFLARQLGERNVRAVHIVEERDGRAQTKAPLKRSAEIASFCDGPAQVLCCGTGAVKLGHNMDQANVVIVHGPPWTHLEFKQFVDRAWRMTSPRDVVAYVVYTAGSLAQRRFDLVLDKGAASDLALDGQLVEKPEEEVNWGDVLRELQRQGVQATGQELSEADLKALWDRAEGPYRPLPAADVAVLPAPAGPPADTPERPVDCPVLPLRPRAPRPAEPEPAATRADGQLGLFAA